MCVCLCVLVYGAKQDLDYTLSKLTEDIIAWASQPKSAVKWENVAFQSIIEFGIKEGTYFVKVLVSSCIIYEESPQKDRHTKECARACACARDQRTQATIV